MAIRRHYFSSERLSIAATDESEELTASVKPTASPVTLPVPVPCGSSSVTWQGKRALENLEEFIDESGSKMPYITSLHIPMARIKSNYKEG